MSEQAHKYHVLIEMIADREGNILLDDKKKPVIRVTTPPEFKGGKPNIISPEDLFVSSLAACKMTTYCSMAEKLNIGLKSLKIDAMGHLEKTEDKGMLFTKIDVQMIIGISDEKNRKNAEKCVELTEKYCLISNSIKSKVNVTSKISVI